MEWLKLQPFCGRIQIVILSGSGNAKAIETALSGAASDFLVKPVIPETLKPKLSLWLQLSSEPMTQLSEKARRKIRTSLGSM